MRPETFYSCCREDSRISLAFVSALNAFLLQHGLDVASMSLDLQRALQPFIMRCWGVARDAKLKDAMVLLLHIQLKLGAVQVRSLDHLNKLPGERVACMYLCLAQGGI